MIKTFEIMITNIVFRPFSSDYHATTANGLYSTFNFIAVKRYTTVARWKI